MSVASGSSIGGAGGDYGGVGAQLTPQQLGVMGKFKNYSNCYN